MQNQYLVCLLLDNYEPGDVFIDWPLHITVVAWFYVDDIEYFASLATMRADRLRSIVSVVREQEKWGKHTVNLLQNTPELQALHVDMLGLIKSTGKLLTKDDFYRDKYRPHVTHQRTGSALVGSRLELGYAYLIQKDIHARPKTVIAKFTLLSE